MGLFRKSKKEQIKDELIQLYVTMFKPFFGLATKKMVIDSIKVCEDQSRKAGFDNLPDNFGEIVINELSKKPGYFKNFVETATEDGATSNDIIKFWNLDDLERRMATWSSEVFGFAAFIQFSSQNMNAEEAMREVRKMFPYYGDSRDENHANGIDRPISEALRDRINVYRTSVGAQKIKNDMNDFSSYNAYVRKLIKQGRI